jgi:hypothetical protein
MTVHLLLAAATAALCAAAHADPEEDTWARVRVSVGAWEGTASGQPGKGTSARTYSFELNDRFIVARNKSVYEPKKAGDKPEIHEDLGIISYDRNLKKLVSRQFHVEGFVNEYTLENAAPDGKSFEFVTQRIENIAPGWRAKESYRIISNDELEESFFLAAPGKDFELYSRTFLKRLAQVGDAGAPPQASIKLNGAHCLNGNNYELDWAEARPPGGP